MSGVIAINPRFQFSSSTGAPLANGTLTVYVAGSTTPTNTWQDQAQTTLNTNPVQLDSRGECVLWLDSAVNYKFVLKNAGGAIQWTQDNISGADAHLRGDLAASSGAAIVGYQGYRINMPSNVQTALSEALTAIRGATGKRYRSVACVLRNTGTGWGVIDDAGHNPINVTAVTENVDGSIKISYPSLGNIVNSLVVCPDETFASYGIVCGASVGSNEANIDIYAPLDFYINLDTGAVTAHDFFLPDISRSLSGVEVLVTHPSIPSASVRPLNATRLGGSGKIDTEVTASITSDTVSNFYFKTRAYAYVSYNGTSFDVAYTNMGTQITAAWSGSGLNLTRPNNGVLTHLGSIQLTPRYPYNIYFDGITGYDALIKFTTLAGVDLTTPNTNVRFTYSEIFDNVAAGAIVVPLGLWSFSAPLAKVKCQNLVSAGGNLWVIGIVELEE